MDTLQVELNREKPHSIAIDTNVFQTDGSFDVLITNHGSAVHVHLQLMEELAEYTTIPTSNYYIEADEEQRARVTVRDGPRPLSGRLKIVTGYGSNTEHVTVELREQTEEDTGVQVAEELGRPQPRQPSSSITPDQFPVIVLGIIAITIALVTGFIVGGWMAILGVLIVLIGIGIAGIILLQ